MDEVSEMSVSKGMDGFAGTLKDSREEGGVLHESTRLYSCPHSLIQLRKYSG